MAYMLGVMCGVGSCSVVCCMLCEVCCVLRKVVGSRLYGYKRQTPINPHECDTTLHTFLLHALILHPTTTRSTTHVLQLFDSPF